MTAETVISNLPQILAEITTLIAAVGALYATIRGNANLAKVATKVDEVHVATGAVAETKPEVKP